MIDGREQEVVLNLKREVWSLTEGQSKVGPSPTTKSGSLLRSQLQFSTLRKLHETSQRVCVQVPHLSAVWFFLTFILPLCDLIKSKSRY